jgi:plastocyanin
MKEDTRRFSLSLALLVMLSLLTTVQAKADAYVYITIDGFSPSSVTIAPGEAVFWVVHDDQGPYTISSDIGAWGPRYLYDYGDMDGLRFNQAGDYTYYDAMNFNSGVVHVQQGVPSTPPLLEVSSPSEGAVFKAPASFTFSVDASDPDEGMSDVEFYLGTDLLDDVYETPFSTTVTNLAAGTYTLTAVAYDLAGTTTTKSVNITVENGSESAPSLSLPNVSGDQVQFTVTGLATGKSFVLQATATLEPSASWIPLQTNLANDVSSSITTPVVEGARFFRLILLP